MAIRFPQQIRHVLIGALALGIMVALIPTRASAAPGTPNTIDSVTAQLRAIAQQNEALAEQLNLVIADVAARQDALQQAQATAAAAQARYASERALLSATLTAQYEGRTSFSRTGALLSSDSGQNYVDRLATLSMMSLHRTDVVSQVALAKTAASNAQSIADGLLRDATNRREDLKQQQTVLAVDQTKFTVLLASLTAAQRAAYQTAGVVTENAQALMIHAGPAAVQIAVNFALAQVGKPYVYDAAGPGSYDCSGLTMAAYAAAGVKLPHNAEAQYAYGTHVAESDLQPGDLLFFYHPIGHVTIYIGNGLMVSAPEPGENVLVTTVASQQDIYTGATRLS